MEPKANFDLTSILSWSLFQKVGGVSPFSVLRGGVEGTPPFPLMDGGGHLGVEGSPSPMPPSDRAVQLEEGPFGSGRAQPSPCLTRPHCLAADVPSPPCWPGRTDGGAEPLRRPPAVPPVPRKAINTRFHRQTKDANRRGGGAIQWGPDGILSPLHPWNHGAQSGSCPAQNPRAQSGSHPHPPDCLGPWLGATPPTQSEPPTPKQAAECMAPPFAMPGSPPRLPPRGPPPTASRCRTPPP